MSDALEDFWAEVLSADPVRIRPAMARLSSDECRHVVVHLRRMATDPGWNEGQRRRALTALDSLGIGSSLEE